MKRIAALTERAAIVRILGHLGVSTGGASDASLARRSLMSWDGELGSRGVVLQLEGRRWRGCVPRRRLGRWIRSLSSLPVLAGSSA